jgi:hypothetical protein
MNLRNRLQYFRESTPSESVGQRGLKVTATKRQLSGKDPAGFVKSVRSQAAAQLPPSAHKYAPDDPRSRKGMFEHPAGHIPAWQSKSSTPVGGAAPRRSVWDSMDPMQRRQAESADRADAGKAAGLNWNKQAPAHKRADLSQVRGVLTRKMGDQVGPRGGRYYIGAGGSKVYVK